MEKESVLCSTGLSLSPADIRTEGLGGGATCALRGIGRIPGLHPPRARAPPLLGQTTKVTPV